MHHNIFISYANPDIDIVENLSTELKTQGIKAWLHSLGRTLAKNAWNEITKMIKESTVIIFVVSKSTKYAEGQKKELDIALEKTLSVSDSTKIMPIFVDDTPTSDAPEELRRKIGIFLNARTVKSTVFKIATQLFPELNSNHLSKPWKYPRPGEWLKISKLKMFLSRNILIKMINYIFVR